ncbi:O-FucT domain protein [Ceratobasidium sp. AG-Ba]|nr:O-FucT domain protein [Ceratobasidium sp. AG-Ba]
MQLSKEHGYFATQARMRIRNLSLRKTSLLAAILCTLGAGVCYTLSERIESSRWAHAVNETQGATPITPAVLVDSNPTVLLNNNATIRFRDNLSPSHKYVTTFTIAGFTNQVIATVNLIYLAILTGRTPIIPPLLPDHFGNLDTVAPIAFSDIFDIPRLTNELNIPVIEWHEVKIPTSSEIESIGCWNTGSVMAATIPQIVTTFTIAGFTNQVIATVNLIYLAILTGRTPIIPPLYLTISATWTLLLL